MAPSFSFNRSWPPEIRMDLIAESFCALALPHLWNQFLSALGIHARLAEDLCVQHRLVEPHASNHLIGNQTMGRGWGYVSHAMMELVKGQYFFRYSSYLLANFMFDLVESLLCHRNCTDFPPIWGYQNTLPTTKSNCVPSFIKLADRHKRVPSLRHIQYLGKLHL